MLRNVAILMFDYFHSYTNTYGWFISVYFLENFILATDQTLYLVSTLLCLDMA